MSYREIEPMVSTIRSLDNTVKTEVWVDQFITEKINSFSRRDIEFFKTITKSTVLLKKLGSREDEIFSSNSIKDTLHRIVKDSSWNPEDEEFLNSHTEEQLYEWLQDDGDNNFLSILRGSMRIFVPMEGDSHRASFGTKLHNALIRLAKRSVVDQIRIKDFLGIQVD